MGLAAFNRMRREKAKSVVIEKAVAYATDENTKQEIMDYLISKGIEFNPRDNKEKLLKLLEV